MILIGVAWLLIAVIAFYQSIHGLFSAVIMAFLTTICAVVALGSYEWLGLAFLYTSQPAYADALSLTIHFVIPLLVLRFIFDKYITGNAPLGVWPDRVAGGVLGIYIALVMVGMLTIILQMMPWGASIIGYKPFDSSLQRVNRLYCDEFALGVFKSSAGLVSNKAFNNVHDDLLLELFCARNTAELNGRVDTEPDALSITAAFKPGDKWNQVVGHAELPVDPTADADADSEVLIVKTLVSKSVRSDRKEDGWYRLPATHYRLVTGSGASLYPMGYLTAESGLWRLHAAEIGGGKAKVANLCVLRRHGKEQFQEIFWVYRLPKADTGEIDFDNSDEIDPAEAERAKAERDEMYAPNYVVFRRTARCLIPAPEPGLLPRQGDPTTKPTTRPTTKPTTRPTTRPKPRT